MKNSKYSNIDLILLVQDILKQRKKLFICMGIAGILGLIVAFSSPKEYTSTVVLAPEMSSAGIGMSSSLADMASTFGIDLGSKGQMDAIYPEIYPDVFASTDFVRTLFDVPVRLQDSNTTRTYIKHIREEVKTPFWSYPKLWLTRLMRKPEIKPSNAADGFEDPFRMSRTDMETCDGIISTISCIIDKKTSEITISFTDQDPMVAAIMVDTLQTRLQNYITEYRTKKARNDYAFYDKLANEAWEKFTKAQNEFSAYCDSHKNPVLASVSTKQQTLENKMSEAYSAYASMKQMREQAKAKIQERTPAFTIIQSPMMQHKPSSRPRIVTLLIFLFLGGIADAIWVLWSRKDESQEA